MEGQRETCRSDRRRQSLVSVGSCPRNGISHQKLVHLYHRERCPVHYDHLWMDHFHSKWKQTQTQRDTELVMDGHVILVKYFVHWFFCKLAQQLLHQFQ